MGVGYEALTRSSISGRHQAHASADALRAGARPTLRARGACGREASVRGTSRASTTLDATSEGLRTSWMDAAPRAGSRRSTRKRKAASGRPSGAHHSSGVVRRSMQRTTGRASSIAISNRQRVSRRARATTHHREGARLRDSRRTSLRARILTREHGVIGTCPSTCRPSKSAPRASINGQTSGRLGRMLYEMLAGIRPFEGPVTTVAAAIVSEGAAADCGSFAQIYPGTRRRRRPHARKGDAERFPDVLLARRRTRSLLSDADRNALHRGGGASRRK
jgi:hypothetical protein